MGACNYEVVPMSFKIERIIPEYEKLGFSRDPLADILDFCVPLQGEERTKSLVAFLREVASVAISGGPKPWYVWGDWRIGKSTFFANLANWVNLNFYKRQVNETLKRESRFKHAIALYLILPPRPERWVDRLARDPYKGIGLELFKQNNPGEYVQSLVDHIYEEIEPEDLKRLERMQMVPDKGTTVRRFLAEKGITERTTVTLKRVYDAPNPDWVVHDIREIPPEEFLRLFKFADCLVVLLLDQMELEGSTEQNFRFIARIVRQFDHVMPIIIDNYGLAIRSGIKVNKAIRALQDIISAGEKLEIKWTPLDFDSILVFWLGRNRNREAKFETDPLEKDAVQLLKQLSIIANVPRIGVFLSLVRETLRMAAYDKAVSDVVSKDFVETNKDALMKIKEIATLKERERIRVRGGVPLVTREELESAEEA